MSSAAVAALDWNSQDRELVAEAVPQSGVLASDEVALATSEAAFDLITTRDGLDGLETAWSALFARAGGGSQLFQSFDWLWHWANHFLPRAGAPGPRLAIVTAHVGGRLVMVWPLVQERIGPITRLSWMGEPVSQYGDVLIDDGVDAMDVLRKAWSFAKARTGASVLRLRKVRQDSRIAPLLVEIGAQVVSEDRAPYLDLASTPSAAERDKRYSSAARRKRKAKRRKLEEQGAVALVRETAGARARDLTAEAFRLKLAWLEQRGVISPALTDPRTQKFFTAVAADVTAAVEFHVHALTSGDRPVAVEIGLSCKGRVVAHISAYDAAFEKFSVGALLWEGCIHRACDDGMAVFDFMAPGDSYKLDWADDAVGVRDWALATSLAGRAYTMLYLGLLRESAKRWLSGLPIGLRRRLSMTLGRSRQSGD